MVTNIKLNLTDDERRAITGRRRPASRKEISEFVSRLVAAALDPAMADATTIVVEEVGESRMTFTIDRGKLQCTSLDHLYPLGPKTPDTPCYCGRNKWGAYSNGGQS